MKSWTLNKNIMIKYYQEVKTILYQVPKSRDNDFLLYWLLVRNKVNDNTTFKEGLQKMSKGALPNIGTISRVRRKVQEDAYKNKEYILCGNRYHKKKLEQKMKEEVKKWH